MTRRIATLLGGLAGIGLAAAAVAVPASASAAPAVSRAAGQTFYT